MSIEPNTRLPQLAAHKQLRAPMLAQLPALQAQHAAAMAELAQEQEVLRQLTEDWMEATQGPTGWLTNLLGGQAAAEKIHQGRETQQTVVAQAEQACAALADEIAIIKQQLATLATLEAEYEAALVAQPQALEQAHPPSVPTLNALTTQVAQQEALCQALTTIQALAYTVATAIQQVRLLLLDAAELEARQSLANSLAPGPRQQARAEAGRASCQHVLFGLTLLNRTVAAGPVQLPTLALAMFEQLSATWGTPGLWSTALQQAQLGQTQLADFMVLVEDHYQTTQTTLATLRAQRAVLIENA